MSRSPLAYPLVRGVDADVGGAADLQTDVMRFMAILALCLVAIFALVQSIPLAPEVPRAAPPETVAPETPVAAIPADLPPPAPAPIAPVPRPVTEPAPVAPATAAKDDQDPPDDRTVPSSDEGATVPAPAPEPEGFTLRFDSDLALTRLVAAGQVGFYAMTPGRAQRMSVRASRVSFWDASQPARFHEMERSTVPTAVIDALRRTGVDPADAGWGVTLPGRLSRELEVLMREHTGGALVIDADGALRREAE